MANEATNITLLGNAGDVVRFTCADGVGIEKGALCVLNDPVTLSGSHALTTGAAFAGIAASEKVASDGSISLGALTNCIADLTMAAGATGNAGQWVCVSGANLIRVATEAELASGAGIGKLLETASSSEVVAVKVMC
jgi:hypothetical protein